MTLKRGSSEIGSTRTRSTAPGAARWPLPIWAPSKAGPVGLEAASSRSRLPRTISAFVPTSTRSRIGSARWGSSARMTPGGVRPDVAGDAGQDVDPRAGVQGQVERVGGGPDRSIRGQGERRRAERDRVDPEDEVVHDRVADEDELEDLVAAGTGGRDQPADQPVERLADGPGHLAGAFAMHHRVRDAAHQVLAEADLRVHDPRRGLDRAGGEVGQVAGDRRRADVDGDPQGTVVEAGPDRGSRRGRRGRRPSPPSRRRGGPPGERGRRRGRPTGRSGPTPARGPRAAGRGRRWGRRGRAR